MVPSRPRKAAVWLTSLGCASLRAPQGGACWAAPRTAADGARLVSGAAPDNQSSISSSSPAGFATAVPPSIRSYMASVIL